MSEGSVKERFENVQVMLFQPLDLICRSLSFFVVVLILALSRCLFLNISKLKNV